MNDEHVGVAHDAVGLGRRLKRRFLLSFQQRSVLQASLAQNGTIISMSAPKNDSFRGRTRTRNAIEVCCLAQKIAMAVGFQTMPVLAAKRC